MTPAESMKNEGAPLTAADLDRLAALDEAATPGPWFAYRSERGPTVQIAAGWLFDTVSGRATQEDAELIAEVVNALPSLLALARRGLEAEAPRRADEPLIGALFWGVEAEEVRRAVEQSKERLARAESAESKLAAALAEVERVRVRLAKATYFEWKDEAGVYWTISCPSWRSTPKEWSVCREIRQIAHGLTLDAAWAAAEAAARPAAPKGGPE